MTGILSHNKVCNIEDFQDNDLRSVIRTVFAHEIQRFGENFPAGYEYRKYWEVAMTVRAMRDAGILNRSSEVLGIGVGNEPTIFWLTNHVGRVFATDLYMESGTWSEYSNVSMLINPEIHWPGKWNPRRLVVQHMNALELIYEDNSFDAIFSSSSIEHFGTIEDVRRSLHEMHRVLKPGGLLTLSTEFRVEGPSPGLQGILLFDSQQTRDTFLDHRKWELTSAFDFSLSEATRRNVKSFSESLMDYNNHIQQHGMIVHHKQDWSSYPMVILRHGPFVWTSMHLSMRKR
jgi:SAM-dependent methyltransferase